MHLLAAKPGGFSDDEGIIDLHQTAGDIVILSAQDTSLGLLAEVVDALPEDYPEVRLANVIHLAKPAAYDLYEHAVLEHASVIIISVLGGRSYWTYGVDQLVSLVKKTAAALIMVPGDDQWDPELEALSNCPGDAAYRIWRYLRHGGIRNTRNLFSYLLETFFPGAAEAARWEEPREFPPCAIYAPDNESIELDRWLRGHDADKPTALLLFYRSHLQSGNTRAFDDFIDVLEPYFNVLSLALVSLKDSGCLDTVNHVLERAGCDVIINTTSFSQHVEGNAALSSSPQLDSPRLFGRDVPVIQAILAANDEEDWAASAQGLRARDITMNIALPEHDGRIISRAVSFKELFRRSERTQMDIVRYRLHRERATFVAELVRGWARLGARPNDRKRIALVLANYPTKDGRVGNAVGLDTPASTINILHALAADGYEVPDIPEDGERLIRILLDHVTNDVDKLSIKRIQQSLDEEVYREYFSMIPGQCQEAVLERWGPVRDDPKFTRGGILVAGIRLGNVFIGIQPARGFNIDLQANYHDPDLVPPHGYLAFYFWLRHEFGADAVVHVGKHGNLEWLPGKSVGLSSACWPDVALGPLPHLYPFIVNDPGEGAQAKRRAQAVILDHMMPPMARAESHGPMQELERLVDELYEALELDPRRERYLREQILALLRDSHIAEEVGIKVDDDTDPDSLLNEVDAYLCELKEAQIRYGLHRYGQTPPPDKLPETLVALTRLPRGESERDRGILHCLCADLDLEREPGERFDPLNPKAGRPWRGKRPAMLVEIMADDWRNEADTRERLELLAQRLIGDLLRDGRRPSGLESTQSLLETIRCDIMPAVERSGEFEIGNLVRALNGRFVPAGPSGAPTRGRLDVLPTGRNFYSLDSRSIPTRTAWRLGQQSAEKLVERHLQEHGDYPRRLGLSVWGTSTMRTGGDDIAQALALMGVQPTWAQGSNRVVDVEIIPGFYLNRPRVDVTLRISGFFRDAFPNVARLFDTAVQVLADYEEPGDINTIRRHIENDRQSFLERGVEHEQAKAQSRFRVFGSKPGSYGAGLQGLIDERVWNDASDLAKAYVNWGGYSYSKNNFGEAAFTAFEQCLGELEAVVQNQDNREHDLLDSDDYYQFQGGMANAVKVLRGQQPMIYHGDHADPANPKIRTLKEELNRVIRARVLNPKWIQGMREHGYKGAFEMAATVDYMFAYDATTGLIDDYQYESVADALVLDADNRRFLEQSNPDALKEMTERLLEAQQRGLWENPGDYPGKLADVMLSIEQTLETVSPQFR